MELYFIPYATVHVRDVDEGFIFVHCFLELWIAVTNGRGHRIFWQRRRSHNCGCIGRVDITHSFLVSQVGSLETALVLKLEIFSSKSEGHDREVP